MNINKFGFAFCVSVCFSHTVAAAVTVTLLTVIIFILCLLLFVISAFWSLKFDYRDNRKSTRIGVFFFFRSYSTLENDKWQILFVLSHEKKPLQMHWKQTKHSCSSTSSMRQSMNCLLVYSFFFAIVSYLYFGHTRKNFLKKKFNLSYAWTQ